MKTADIKVGEDYALGGQRDKSGRYYSSDYQAPDRVTVLRVNAPRKKYNGTWGPTTTVNNGVEIEGVNKYSGEKWKRVVTAQMIREPWSEYAAEKARHDAERDSAQAKVEARRQPVMDSLLDLFDGLNLPVEETNRSNVVFVDGPNGRVRVTVE